MQRTTSLVEGEFYHIYNRGVDKRVIFASEANYKRFMMLLYLTNSVETVRMDNILKYNGYDDVFNLSRSNQLVAIGAFCLMPNHFHILITPLVENGLSKFMLKLQTGYSMYFNKLKTRSGSLFQGPFQSEYAGEDRYLKYLFAYIHLNPAKLKDSNWRENVGSINKSIQTFISEYPYSSLKEYLSKTYVITSPEFFPNYFATPKELFEHTANWLELGQDDFEG